MILNDSEIELLKNELEQEKQYRESAAWQNQELEKRIVNVQDELRKEDYISEYDEDLQKENIRNKQLYEENAFLKEKIPILKEKIKNAKNCGPDCKLKHDDLNINLDVLTAPELLRTVKRFERTKTDLISTLRSKEWRLDSEAKLFVRLNDQRTYLQNELLICQNNIMRLKKEGPFIRWGSYFPKKEHRNDQKINTSEKLPPISSNA